MAKVEVSAQVGRRASDDTSACVLLGGARTPFGRFGGSLRDVELPDLGAAAVRGALDRARTSSESVDELVMGVNFPGSQRSIARQVALRAGIPQDRTAYTVDRACCSSLTAVGLGMRALRLGDARIVVAGGVENLSRVPYFLHGRFGPGLGAIEVTDQLVMRCLHTGELRAIQADREAAGMGISREEQDEWALRSQERYAAASRKGYVDEEVVPISTSYASGLDSGDALLVDETPRPDSTPQALEALKPVYGSLSVTPGNAPDLSTGAAALVLGEPRSGETDDGPITWIYPPVMVAGPSSGIASIPARAVQRLLERSVLELNQVDLFEINEAFAAVPLVTTMILADGDREQCASLRERTNVNGGAVAMGHPTGATAARLVLTISAELRRRGGGTGAVAICGGIGEAEACLIRVL